MAKTKKYGYKKEVPDEYYEWFKKNVTAHYTPASKNFDLGFETPISQVLRELPMANEFILYRCMLRLARENGFKITISRL